MDRVYEGPSYDIVFDIKENEKFPYINRGLQSYDIDLPAWKEKLEGQQVEMTLIKHWTPFSKDKFIAKVALLDGEVLFSRL